MTTAFDRRRAIASLAGIGAMGLIVRPALAQSTSGETSPEATITVTATGSAETPATIAIGQLVVHPIMANQPIDPATSEPVEATYEVTQNDLDALVGALTDDGIAAEKILSATGGFFGPGSGVVVFQIEGEAIKTVGKTLDLLTEAAVVQGVAFDPPAIALLADGCDDLRAQAFADAVTAGRADATMLAAAMDVELGALIQATKISVGFGNMYTYGQSDSCADLINLASALNLYLPGWSEATPNIFAVYATVELTFATA